MSKDLVRMAESESQVEIEAILAAFRQVELGRQACASDPSLSDALARLKGFQLARLRKTHEQLFEDPNEGCAASFFLEDLYGLGDFSSRDREFQRIVPALVRLFPADVVNTVKQLSSLHALSEDLDLSMARVLRGVPLIDMPSYRSAWRCVSGEQVRDNQRALTLSVGLALAKQTRNSTLRRSLKLMRGPARLTGLGQLQGFLERGFETFGALKRPDAFLLGIVERERLFAVDMFANEPGTD